MEHRFRKVAYVAVVLCLDVCRSPTLLAYQTNFAEVLPRVQELNEVLVPIFVRHIDFAISLRDEVNVVSNLSLPNGFRQILAGGGGANE